MANVVVLKGYGMRKEGLADGAVTPGHVVYRSSATEFKVGRKGGAGESGPRSFCDINPGVGRALDDNYADEDQINVYYAHSGDEINALVAASAPAIAVGNTLEAAADGTVIVVTADSATGNGERDSTIGYAVEAVDNSSGSSAVRIKIEVS